jgi:hypothetical protein
MTYWLIAPGIRAEQKTGEKSLAQLSDKPFYEVGEIIHEFSPLLVWRFGNWRVEHTEYVRTSSQEQSS